jgi:hypothetical protein
VKGALPDMLHSFYSLAWLSLSTQDDGDTLSKPKIDNNVDDDVFLLQLLECAIGICKQRIVSYERFCF